MCIDTLHGVFNYWLRDIFVNELVKSLGKRNKQRKYK
jgi:hypothetical protein